MIMGMAIANNAQRNEGYRNCIEKFSLKLFGFGI
jgi:hypothetical protein